MADAPRGYWRSIAGEAFRQAVVDLRLNSPASIFNLVFGHVVGAALLFIVVGTVAGASLWTRIATAAATLIAVPTWFLVRMITTPPNRDSARVSMIKALEAKIIEMETEGQSDITITLDLNHTVNAHPDRPLMHTYAVIAENNGPNVLTECVFRIYTVNQFNVVLTSRVWAHDASEAFILRPGEPKQLIFLWTNALEPWREAVPHYHSDTGDFWDDGRTGYEILNDQEHLIFCEVLSANTIPAKIAIHLWRDDNEEWQLEAVDPADTPKYLA